jgi:oligoendopeptidase F
VELTASNYILLQTSNDRVLRKNAFESYYKRLLWKKRQKQENQMYRKRQKRPEA